MILRKFKKLALILTVFSFAFSLFCVSASAEEVTMDTAQEAVLRELEVLKDMGLLSEKVRLSGGADMIIDREEEVADEYWFGRAFPHRFQAMWYYDRNSDPDEFSGVVCVDADSGKISYLNLTCFPRGDVEPVREKDIDGQTVYFYDNFEDIFPADMTVDKFCSLLAEYWGFSGYTLSNTDDEMYGYFEAVSGDSLLKDMPTDNYYLTVYFEGDQEGVPMYVQIMQPIDQVCLMLGTNHAVG